MKKLLKYTGISVGLLLVLAIIAVVAATLLIDTNAYRDKISELVKKETGRDLQIKGDLGLSFFPWVGLNIGETTLSNAPGFGDKPFARFEQINLKVKLLPLLKKSVEMDAIVLDGMNLNLARNKKGVSNWDDLVKAGESKPVEKKDGPTEKMSLESLHIGGLQIKDANMTWVDEQAGAAYSLADLQLKSGAISADKPVKFKLDFDLKDNKAAKSWHFGMDSLLKLDFAKQTVNLDQLKLQLANIRLQGHVHVAQFLSDPAFNANLKSSEFVPRESFADFGIALPKTSDATVFGKALLELALKGTTNSVDVNKLLVRLDDSSLNGSLAVSNFKQPAVRFDMKLDQIDVDRYLPPVQQQKTTNKQAPLDDKIVLPVEMLRGLNINGKLAIGKMKASNLRSEAINMKVRASKGLIRVHPSTAKMYGGSYAGDVSLDVRGKALVLSMNEKLSAIQASPLFKDLADLDWIDGKGNLSAKLTGRGNSMSAIRSSLQGNLAISFLDGKIKGVNIPYKIKQAYALIKGLPAPAAEPEETPFTSIKATASVKGGVVNNRDMVMDTPVVVVNGAGQVDLGKESVDYLVKATVSEKLTEAAGEALNKLKGRTVPVRVRGPFTKLKYNVELDAVLKEQVKKKVEDKVKRKLDEKVGDKLKDKLKGLF